MMIVPGAPPFCYGSVHLISIMNNEILPILEKIARHGKARIAHPDVANSLALALPTISCHDS